MSKYDPTKMKQTSTHFGKRCRIGTRCRRFPLFTHHYGGIGSRPKPSARLSQALEPGPLPRAVHRARTGSVESLRSLHFFPQAMLSR